MTSFNMQFDVNNALSRWNHIPDVVADAARETLNKLAMDGADEDRRELERVFVLRNKWIYNSIWPKHGKRFGLIPPYKKDINRMYTTAGTVNRDLEKQEGGFTKRDPSIPTRYARVAGSNKRVISKKYRLKNIGNQPTIKAKNFGENIPNHRDRISSLLAFVNEINWKGLIYIDRDSVLPEGYYQFKGRSLRLIRRNQRGTKHRRAFRWHREAMRRYEHVANAQLLFNANMFQSISKLT